MLSTLNLTFDDAQLPRLFTQAQIVIYSNALSQLDSLGLGKVTLTDIEAGLSQCTHLVYGYASINDNSKVVSINANQDLDQGKGL